MGGLRGARPVTHIWTTARRLARFDNDEIRGAIPPYELQARDLLRSTAATTRQALR